jgi:regulator of protease activity HflC (stomatin/prohibitin superfamily)
VGLRQSLNAEVEPYGVEINKINVTDARPPEEFLRSLESRQLAVVQREEQAQRQALAQHVQANVETLARQKAIAEVERDRELLQVQVQQAETRRKIAQLEAETEDLRLSRLEERLLKYPHAAAYEMQRAQLEIARALAGNTRAVLQIGDADGILRAYVMRESLKDGEDPGLMGLAEQAGAVPGLEPQVDASPDEKVEG